MQRTTIWLFLFSFVTSGVMAQGPLSQADADYLKSLPDTLGAQAEKAGTMSDGVRLNGAMTQDDADFLRQTQRRVEDFRQTPPSDFLQQLQQRKTPEPDSDFMATLTQRQQAALSQLEMRGQGERPPEGDAYYFLSFSLPDEALGRLIDQASRYAIPATIRGLIDNNMQKTTAKMFDLVKETNRGGLSIDPEAFGRYGITAVPALVVRCGNTFDVVYGDISLKGLLKKVSEDGECRKAAKAYLKKGGGDD
ncbi:TPA: type-F conjugative transfer system pilin assembly protein TrbC [Escherichia coli]|nr:type-F conjugative transfer system pilin assembly protein TrbC [Escherichia coli]HAV9253347.1 type-F conjugative transfer system pilin assembly protein TrbC [Escherichia coli]HAW0316572.1 type-F conjugative transfer system pilin assembly protein TrbC [Escherichia coli]HAW1122963.1 type-F conjugative transfer system pilin assembly protein TrbC [Escherichia coli]HCH7642717.1 type-F conjugative transfer system pilin assembly protein TrbC [Escherichia coli]